MPANYSHERRATALSWLRGEGILEDATMPESARILATVGLVICDEKGHIPQSELVTAMNDPSVTNYARNLLAEAREEAV